jgi:inhibitor of KinA sporulation pathway (predicted exonuclease)
MKLTALDLELNQPSGKIIQIGAVIGDTDSGEISQRLRIYVDPKEKLNDFIIELTGISQKDIDEKGVTLEEAYAQLSDFHQRHSTFINPLTWGGGDSEEIFSQLGLEKYDSFCFGRRWIDAKTLYVSECIARGLPVQGGLSKVMTKYNMNFKGRKHDALDDAENTFRLYHEMLLRIRHK